jgi:hypothetical protein
MRGNLTKLEQGGWPNKAPFGYKNHKATKTIQMDKRTRPIVERIFELYASGHYSIQGVATQLYAEGFRTPKAQKSPNQKLMQSSAILSTSA